MAETKYPTYKLSNKLLESIASLYSSQFNIELDKDPRLSESIQWASDFFIQNPDVSSPWGDKRFQKAYLAYFLPLNYLRSKGVVDRLKQVSFFNDTTSDFLEWGSGNGAFSLALFESEEVVSTYSCIEKEAIAIDQHKKIQRVDKLQWINQVNKKNVKNKTIVFSYSFTELDKLPEWVYSAENIIIVEPSTNQDGRRLMSLKEDFVTKGFNVWAPCTHSGSCPLLKGSEKDWCHDSYKVEYPNYVKKATDKLLIQLNAPSASYLALSKRAVPESLSDLARITGNTLKERGKVRQLVCRNDEREFLSWFTKRQEVPFIPRGSLVDLPSDLEKKSNELRTKSEILVVDSISKK